ncbi:MAG: beta-ketoacyl-[acyl-carrier-protein] synthase family protein [Phycisphaerales bacterium]
MSNAGSHVGLSDRERVVITGVGWVTPLGADVPSVWSKLLNGVSGIGPIRRFDATTFTTNFAAQSPDVDLAGFFADPSPFAGAGLNSRFALAAAAQAWKQSGLGDVSVPGQKYAGLPTLNRARMGIYLGSGEGALDFDPFIAANLTSWNDEARASDPAVWAKTAYARMTAVREIEQEPNMPLSHLADAFGAMGPSYNCLTACAASTQAIGEAFEILRRGDAEVMMAGGTHSMIHPLGITGFIRLTALSSRRDDPQGASRPFDQTRDGFVMGEGAGIVILETLEHAKNRGGTPLAEVTGFGSSADAFRITDIQPEGLGAQAAMREALEQAGIEPGETDDSGRPVIHYISAHGTGTKENDSIETRAIKGVFGDLAPKIPVSSIKSSMGHLIAAAGVVECIACVQAIHTGMLPPTVNLRHPDPVCDLDYIPNEHRDERERGGVEVCLSNSFGFGGQNDTLIVRRFRG